MLKFLRLVFVLAAAAFGGTGYAQSQPQRIALVIGNSAYKAPGWALPNPKRDADLIAQRLRSLGFNVDLVHDATEAQMRAAFQRHGARLKAGGESAIGVFYFAGHGAQSNGDNLLVPVDITARTMVQLRYQSPPMQYLLQDMADAGNAVNIVILDACRNVPLEEGPRSGGGGLADLSVPNVFVAFAAAPGKTASDGAGGNSPYTTELARLLAEKPWAPLSLLFEEVQFAVYASSGNAQRPEFRNGLMLPPGWSLAAAPATAPAQAPRQPPVTTAPPATTQPSLSEVDRRVAQIATTLPVTYGVNPPTAAALAQAQTDLQDALSAGAGPDARYFLSVIESHKRSANPSAGAPAPAISNADSAFASNHRDQRYRTQACLARLMFGVIDSSQLYCLVDEGRTGDDAAQSYFNQGLYHLSDAGRRRGGDQSRALEAAYRAFSEGLSKANAETDPALTARLKIGQGITLYCVGLTSMGLQTMDSAMDPAVRDAARAYFTAFKVNVCPRRT